MTENNTPATSPAFSVCVYCGSKPGNSPEFAQIAVQVGTWIGQHGGQLVYGGGRNGLMGLVAEATLAAGGRIAGGSGIDTLKLAAGTTLGATAA